MILNSLKNELKKFTRFATSPVKNLKASDFAKALDKLSGEIRVQLYETRKPTEIIEGIQKKVKNVFTTTVLKKYYKPDENSKLTWKRSGFVGFILRELYIYLTECFLKYPIPQFMPEWLKISDKTTLKKAFKDTYQNVTGNDEKWIASVLYDNRVLESFIEVHNAIEKFYESKALDSDENNIFLPEKSFENFNKSFEDLKKIGSADDYEEIAKGFLNWAKKFRYLYSNLVGKNKDKNDFFKEMGKILDIKKIEKYEKDVEKYRIHIIRVCSNLRMLFIGADRYYVFQSSEYGDEFFENAKVAISCVFEKIKQLSPDHNKDVVEVSDKEFLKVVGSDYPSDEDVKTQMREDDNLERYLWGSTGEPELDDLKQSGLGTCYLHSALMSLLQSDKGKKLIKKCFVSMDENYVTMQLYKIKKVESYEKSGSDGTPKKGVTFIPEESPTLFKLKRTHDKEKGNTNRTNALWPHYFIKVFSNYKKLIPSDEPGISSMYCSPAVMLLNEIFNRGKRFVESGKGSWVFAAITGRNGSNNDVPEFYGKLVNSSLPGMGKVIKMDTVSKMDPIRYLKNKFSDSANNKFYALTCGFIKSTYRLYSHHEYTIVGIKDGGVCLLEPNRTRPLPLNFNELNEKGIERFETALGTKDAITAQNWKAKVEEFKKMYAYDEKVINELKPFGWFKKEHFKDGKDEFIVPFEEFKSNCKAIDKVNLSKKKGAQGKKS